MRRLLACAVAAVLTCPAAARADALEPVGGLFTAAAL